MKKYKRLFEHKIIYKKDKVDNVIVGVFVIINGVYTYYFDYNRANNINIQSITFHGKDPYPHKWLDTVRTLKDAKKWVEETINI